MIHKRGSTHKDKIVVTFEIPGSIWAERIHLVGDFNGWDRDSLPFQPTRQENWQVQIELDQGREYRFRYLVDGVYWQSEWHADRHSAGEDGVFDSVVIAQLPQAA
jgi:1,4-alpha-glucan branching enzyme